MMMMVIVLSRFMLNSAGPSENQHEYGQIIIIIIIIKNNGYRSEGL
jgi:hypothetical protein